MKEIRFRACMPAKKHAPTRFNPGLASALVTLLLVFGPGSRTVFSQADAVNLALTASVTTSHVSPWETLSAVNDGHTPASSADASNGAYGNWNYAANYGALNWVQYEWTLAKRLTAVAVYWWADGQGIQLPTEAYIEYWNGSSWTRAGDIGRLADRYNALELDILTSRIRIYMRSALATGILEFRTLGVDAGPCDASVVTPYTKIGDAQVLPDNAAVVVAGGSVSLLPEAASNGAWSWLGPDGLTATGRAITLSDLSARKSGTYTSCFINGEETRKAHYDYRLELIEGVKGTADVSTTWFDWTKVLAAGIEPGTLMWGK